MGEYLQEAYLKKEIEDEQTKKIHELEQELKIRIDANADLYAKLCNSLNQIEEANKVIKKINRMSGNVDLSPLPYKDRRKVDGITIQTYEYIENWGVE